MGVSCFTRPGVEETVRRLSEVPHLSILVGAGASAPAGLPTWERLVTRLISEGSGRETDKVAQRLIDTQGYLLAAEAAFEPEAESLERRKKVAAALYGSPGRRRFYPSRLHQAVAKLALCSLERGNQVELFTTNYDGLLEEAVNEALGDGGPACQPRCRWRNPRRPDVVPVHHIHGYLDAEDETADSDDVVVGSLDYERIAQASWDWPGEELGAALAKGPILFVGTSLTDPNLLRILAKLRNRHDHGRDGGEDNTLLLAWQGLGVGEDDRERFGHLLDNLWRRYRIKAVLLDDYSDLTLFLHETAQVTANPDHLPAPGKRVASFHDQVMSHFEVLRGVFADELQRDLGGGLAKVLGEGKGYEQTLSLWLSDGHGRIWLVGSTGKSRGDGDDLYWRRDNHGDGWITPLAMAWDAARASAPQRTPEDGPEGEAADGPGRWRSVGAAPLRLPLEGGPPVAVGALSYGTTRPWDEQDPVFRQAGTILEEELVAKWEALLDRIAEME